MLPGGTTGQIPTKNSATDYDWSWADPTGGGGGGGLIHLVSYESRAVDFDQMVLGSDGGLYYCIDDGNYRTTSSGYPRTGTNWDADFLPLAGNLNYHGDWDSSGTGDQDIVMPNDVVYYTYEEDSGGNKGRFFGGLFKTDNKHWMGGSGVSNSDPYEDFHTSDGDYGRDPVNWQFLGGDPWQGAGMVTKFIPVEDMYLPVTSPCSAITLTEIGTGSTPRNCPHIAWFDPSTDEYIYFSIDLPDNWDYTFYPFLDFRIHWTVAGTDTGDVVWRVYGRGFEQGDNLNASLSWMDDLTDTAIGTAYKQHITPGFPYGAYSVSGSNDKSMNKFAIRRVASSGNDTMTTADAGLLGIEVTYWQRYGAGLQNEEF
jgi:hypothetical protein